MNIVETIENFQISNVFYLDPIKNTVIDNSNFIRILYSNELFTLNGIYLKLNFNNVYLTNYNNKIKYYFTVEKNMNLLSYIKDLELNLLKRSNIKNKIKTTKILDQLNSGFIKIYCEQEEYIPECMSKCMTEFILKISGLWESNKEFGLTYKFIDISNNI